MSASISCMAAQSAGRYTKKRLRSLTAAGAHEHQYDTAALFPHDQPPIVLSAAGRTDLVSCYTEFLIEKTS